MKLFRNAVERPRHKAGPARREGPVTALPARLAPSVLPSGLQGSENIIDMDHLARMTLGDASLTVDILRLFDRQAAMLVLQDWGVVNHSRQLSVVRGQLSMVHGRN